VPNEQHQNDSLISTDEAKMVIDLYAKKEQARLAEQKRIAAMPKLADTAEMAGLSLDEARRLALQCRIETDSDYRIKLELDPNGEEHLSEFDVKLLMARIAEVERSKQQEFEEESRLTPLADVAQDLGVSVDEARDLLKVVRRRGRWASSIPHFDRQPELSNVAAKTILAAMVFVALTIVAAAVWFLRPTAPAPAAPIPVGVSNTVDAPWHPNRNWVTMIGGLDLPYGAMVVYNLSPGQMYVSSASSPSTDPISPRLKTFLKTFRPASIPGATNVPLVPVPGYSVPLSPTSELPLSSDIAGWVAVTVHTPDGKKRSAYLPDKIGRNYFDTSAGLEYRLNYLAGLPNKPLADYKLPSVTKIDLKQARVPRGTRMTVCGRGQVFQSVSADPKQTISAEQMKDAMRKFLTEACKQGLATKNWKVPGAAASENRLTSGSYILEYNQYYGTRSFDCTRLFSALKTENKKELAATWKELDVFMAAAIEAAKNGQP